MFPNSTSSKLRSTRTRRRKTNKIRQQQSTKVEHRTTAIPTIVQRFHELITDLNRPGSRFSLYTIVELEPICQQIAIQQMSTTESVTEYCPLICTFCQSLIYEPITLYCGHTFCEQCIENPHFSSSINCPRCPDDIQGQIQSPIEHAREKSYRKNRFLKELFEHSETFKDTCEMKLLCNQGQTEYSNGNYDQAIEIFTQIINQNPDHHLALYNRARTYRAMEQYDQALSDAVQVVTLKSQWAKGYICQSEILFDMNHFAAALMISLKALVIDPEDQAAKHTMAQHLHAVLHNHDDERSISEMDAQLERLTLPTVSTDNAVQAATTATASLDDSPTLTMCKTSQPNKPCLCRRFDHQNLNVKDFDCSICVNLLWFPVTTPCGHVFCRECLIRSVDNTQILCPICKSSLENFFPMLIQSHVNKTEVICKIIETYFPTEYQERSQSYQQESNPSASAVQANPEENIFEIPIFVCVLAVPYCVCPLHVFEPRYRLMMRRTVDTESRTFGMCSYDEQAGTFADYGTLLYIRGLVYTQDGRSIVDTIGQRRFRVIERGMRDAYNTARVQLIRDDPIEQHEFDDLTRLNRDTYNRVRHWFDNLDPYRKTLIMRQLEEYPPCDDLTEGSTDGPRWAWIMLNLLPIDPLLQYTALASRSFRIRLQMINDTMDFLLNQPVAAAPAAAAVPSTTDEQEN